MADPLFLYKFIQFKGNLVPVEVTPRELEDRIRNTSGSRGRCDAIQTVKWFASRWSTTYRYDKIKNIDKSITWSVRFPDFENLWAEGSGKSEERYRESVYLIYIKIIVR
jgi:hypothetical protein